MSFSLYALCIREHYQADYGGTITGVLEVLIVGLTV